MNAVLMRRIRHLQRWESGTIRVLGLIELLLAAALFVCGLYAYFVGEDSTIFLYIFPIVGGLGLFQTIFFSKKEKMIPSVGILLIAEMWAISFVVSAIPFIIYGMSPVDSFFEGISGYTTTGASIVQDLNVLPDSLLLWRGVIQWTGGITVLISFSFLLPMIGMGGAGLNSNEFMGSDSDNYSLKITTASLNFLKVYSILTVIEIFALMACSVSAFDSLCISLSNIPTGGLLPRNESMACYNIYAQAVTLVFMVLGAMNFYLMFRAMFKKDGTLLRSKEARFMIKWFLGCTVVSFLFMFINGDLGYELEGLDTYSQYAWISLYAVISSGTGAGFSIYSYSDVPHFMFMILMIAEFVGGTSGSTAGGIKIYRLMALKSYIMGNLNRVLHPNAIYTIRADGKNMDDDAVHSALSTIFLFMLGTILGLLIFMALEPQIDMVTSIGIVFSAITNAGIAPVDNFGFLTFASKILLCFLMWLGRMEMVLIIILFTKGFWSDLRLSLGHSRVAKRRPHNGGYRSR
ncbi:MAG: TrkH family potassium uptake protein [archaeon]|nr:TrkH family potassium uptake protein [archaeon]